jgi:hypothetical protein
MSSIYVFESTVVKSGPKYFIYLPKKYREKVGRLHGKRIKVIVIAEE